MAHFAKLNSDNVVIAVHVINNDVITINNEESESAGIEFLTNLHNYDRWVQTSYNSNFRGTYAGIGFTYNEEEDIFITPQPYPSWVRSGSFWNAPIEYPNDENKYIWNEENLSWDLFNEPIL